MKKFIILISLLFLLTLLVPPNQADADRGGGGPGISGGHGGSGGRGGSGGDGVYRGSGRPGDQGRGGARGVYRGHYRYPGHGGYRWYGGYGGFFPGLFIGGVLGWSLWPGYYYPPAYDYPPPPPPDYYYPPPPEGSQAPPSESQGSGGQMFIYPRQGQSEEQQSKDFNECHNWAVGQTDFDPAKPPDGAPDAQTMQKSADYLRAISVCLDARGYTLR